MSYRTEYISYGVIVIVDSECGVAVFVVSNYFLGLWERRSADCKQARRCLFDVKQHIPEFPAEVLPVFIAVVYILYQIDQIEAVSLHILKQTIILDADISFDPRLRCFLFQLH